MRSVYQKVSAKPLNESGQTMVIVILALGLFLLGAVGFGVDVANLWFHRQAAQTAADAACTAGAMDFLLNAEGSASYSWINSVTDCSGRSSGATAIAPCWYAAQNGYNSAGLIGQTPSNDVKLSYPTSVSSVPSGSVPPAGLAAVKYLQVSVIDRTKVFFMGLITGSKTMDVGAKAVCGLVLAKAPVPIIVLNPTCQTPFQISGSATIQIVGGPTRSIQVNSDNTTCAAATSPSQCNGSATIDLSQGGPSFSGSSFGVFGAPTSAPSNFNGGTTGSWQPSASPISDPYALTSAPSLPSSVSATNNGGVSVAYGTNGCPDHSGCKEYYPGLYTLPIVVKGFTAIFDPGVYYLQPTSFQTERGGQPGCVGAARAPTQQNYDLAVDSNGVVRIADNSAPNGDGSHGVMFYLSGPGGSTGYGSVFFGSNAGNYGGRTVDPYSTSAVYSDCGATAPSGGPAFPSTLNGNVLLGQCTAGGTYTGSGSTDTSGPVRGLIFFQNRNNGTNQAYANGGQGAMQGGGGLLMAGNLYFHNCPSLPCAPYSTNYNAYLELQGTPGGGTYVVGNITADQLEEAGNGSIYMQLNPNAIYYILKASLLQ